MKITTQHAQMKVTAEAVLRTVTATRQAVAGLQRADRRFDARMTLACLMELDRCVFVLLGSLTRAWHGKTGVGDHLSELLLVLRGVKALSLIHI